MGDSPAGERQHDRRDRREDRDRAQQPLPDGIRFQGLRYLDATLADYVGRAVTIRYDPRDITEIRVFIDDRFLCRAISPDWAGPAITLKDVQAARVAHRRAMRAKLTAGRSAVAEYLSRGAPEPKYTPKVSAPHPARTEPARPPLATYYEDLKSP